MSGAKVEPQRPAVLYARVSSAEQEKDGFSIPAQLKLLQGYAPTHALQIVQEFVDVETAKQAGRTNFDLMVEFLQTHPTVRVVLVEKTDRLYRNFRDYVTLDDLDLEIHLVKEGEVLSQDSRSHQKFIHGIKVLMAKNYIDNLSEEVKKGHAEKVARGEYPHLAPVGYLNDTTNHMIVVDPDKAPFVRKMFECYATGDESLADIRKRAVAAGFRPTRRGTQPMSKSKVELILKNPFYMGSFRWKGGIFEGSHEAIITPELFEDVQKVFKSHGKRRGQYRVNEFAFAGLMTCGKCGRTITGTIKKGKYIYYRCAQSGVDCDEGYVREQALEPQFAEAVRRVVIDEKTLGWIKEALRESHQDETAFHEAEIARITGEVKTVGRRLDQVYLDKLDGKVTEEFWAERSRDWQGQKTALLAELGRHEAAQDDYLDSGVELLELTQRAHSVYLKGKPEEKRKLLQILHWNSSLLEGVLTFTYRKPFDELVDTAAWAEQSAVASGGENGKTAMWGERRDSNPRPPGPQPGALTS